LDDLPHDIIAGGASPLALLRPCPDDWLRIWPVDNKLGNMRNTGAELVLRAETRI
jgi:putative SOS response-associated peptidase YedK